MPFHLRCAPDDVPHTRFAVSPLWETRSAVRALDRPGPPGTRLPWLRRIQVAASGLNLAPLSLLAPAHGCGPRFLAPRPADPYTRIEDELARVRATDPAVARGELERTLAGTPGAAASLRGRRMLEDPGRAVKELADLLELAWRALIEPDWPALHALLEADAAFHARRLAGCGPEGLFAELHPDVSWADGTLTIAHTGPAGPGTTGAGRSTGTGAAEAPEGTEAAGAPERPEGAEGAEGRGLLLVPSVFCRPGPAAGGGVPWDRALVYPARGLGGLWESSGEQPPEVLSRLLGRGRAAVLTALEEPASTTGLARRLGLAPSSVSAHLAALRDAGLLTSHRYGHQVLYERTPLGIALAAG
ncbi:winged helix-turn-helix transcriptional regulator [Streptomyces sp. F63]|uniref:ArsR/SmtB family transcription factor n=1 Tax=Streptomyces sp. F63 TaxID=2824887 RepID=UPI001B37712D|nr:helix-turn-helix domain-containing protein [Streptomyces sp. F63]MBQ0984056.1 winged helix-turn-helix transcriptional regulator [Streptomyces sp. F63]